MAMTVNVNVRLDLSDSLKGWIMSALSDAIDQALDESNQAILRATTTVEGMRQQIAALQATIDAGGTTPENLAKLGQLVMNMRAIDPTNPATIPAAIPMPAPAPAPV